MAARNSGRSSEQQAGQRPAAAQHHGREEEQRQHHHQQVAGVVGEVDRRLHLHPPRQRRAQDAAEQLPGRLDRSLGPAELLALEAVDVHRQLARHGELRQVDELPAGELGAVGEVEVLGQGVVLPAAGGGDRLAAPDAGGAVEVEEAAGAVARRVLDHEVAVEEDRLHAGEQRVVAVQVLPARLHHPHLGVGEPGHGAAQEVGPRHEVGVEHRQQLAARPLGAGGQRAGLEAAAVAAVQMVDVEAAGALPRHRFGHHLDGLVGGVVEDLDLQPVARVIERADGVHQAPGDVHLVVEWKLNRDLRQLLVGEARRRGSARAAPANPAAAAQEQHHHHHAVHPVQRQHPEDAVVEGQHGCRQPRTR